MLPPLSAPSFPSPALPPPFFPPHTPLRAIQHQAYAGRTVLAPPPSLLQPVLTSLPPPRPPLPQVIRHFSIVRKLDGQSWPPGFEAAVLAENATPRGKTNGGNMLVLQTSERALLTCLLARLQVGGGGPHCWGVGRHIHERGGYRAAAEGANTHFHATACSTGPSTLQPIAPAHGPLPRYSL